MITVTIAGNVGKDAEMRRAGDQDVCGFSVAAETPKKETIWFDVSIWGKRGEAVCKYISKGDKVTVTGSFSTREHDGKTYYKIDAHEIALQGGSSAKRDDDDRGGRESSTRDRDDRPRDDRRGDDRPRDERRDDRGRDRPREEPRRDERPRGNLPY